MLYLNGVADAIEERVTMSGIAVGIQEACLIQYLSKEECVAMESSERNCL